MCSISSAPLDTLGQLVTSSVDRAEKEGVVDVRLSKMARSKFLTRALVLRLVDVEGSPLHKSYWSTYHCATALEQRGSVIRTKYCDHRWCLVCNRNRAGDLMNGYADVIKAFPDAHHLVLTKPTVEGGVLRADIEEMIANFKRITRRLSKKGIVVRGLRKLECTYNPVTDRYHPHFHLLVETFEQGKQLRIEWLKQYSTANFSSQKLDRADDGALMELLKYFTKILPSSSKVTGRVEIHPKALDVMFVAMRRKRTIQPFGIEKIPTKTGKTEYNVPERDYTIWVWEQSVADYEDFLTQEPLTGYKVDEATLDFAQVIMGGNNSDRV